MRPRSSGNARSGVARSDESFHCRTKIQQHAVRMTTRLTRESGEDHGLQRASHHISAEPGRILSQMILPRCLKGMSTLRRASSNENSVSVPLAIAHEQASVASFHRDATGRPRTRSVEEVVDRGMLITLAHRRLGGAADAEDIVQETYLRWYRLTAAERQLIQSPVAWCVRVATRLSLDLLNSARRRHEHNLGSGLPDGAVASFDADLASASIDPADVITLDESVS